MVHYFTCVGGGSICVCFVAPLSSLTRQAPFDPWKLFLTSPAAGASHPSLTTSVTMPSICAPSMVSASDRFSRGAAVANDVPRCTARPSRRTASEDLSASTDAEGDGQGLAVCVASARGGLSFCTVRIGLKSRCIGDGMQFSMEWASSGIVIKNKIQIAPSLAAGKDPSRGVWHSGGQGIAARRNSA